jgi:cytochrome c-type biogenesis protein CcmF
VLENSPFAIPHSPTAAFGTIVLLAAFVVAAFSLATGVIGARQRRGRLVNASVYGLWGVSGLLTLASALLVYAFVSHDYTIKYVAHYSDTSMPLWYKITAYWGGLDGSLMFWCFVLAGFSTIAVWANRERHRDMMGYVVATIMGIQLFFLALLIYSKNPFATFLTEPPIDGKGLNPLLQNYWMVIHPPSLYIGFVAASIPFAFCIGALASGRLDDSWIYSIRIWILVCWFFLSFGLILGGRWAYEELGWGGYWAWDPVENAGFLPWFTASAVLHSIIIQEQRGSMKVWNVVLCIFTFFLTIFGTFMTRSGVVQSVHAFGEDNELALLFILFMAFIWVFSVGLLLFRLPQLRTKSSFDSFVSREFAFLLNNWILLSCALFVLFATMFPTISEALRGQRITVGPPFFNKWMVPMGLVLVLLAGAAPLLAWRRSSIDRLKGQFLFPVACAVLTMGLLASLAPRTLVLTSIFSNQIKLPVALLNFGIVAFTLAACLQEFWKGARVRRRQSGSDPVTSLIGITLAKRRRYGGYLVHMGVAVMFIGFAGKAFETEKDFTLQQPGTTRAAMERADNPLSLAEAITQCSAGNQPDCAFVKGYLFRYDGFFRCPDPQGVNPRCANVNGDHKTTWTAQVEVITKEGQRIDTLLPARWRFAKLPDQPTTEPAINAHGADDVYLAMLGFQENQASVANFRVFLNPLINWVWLGFVLLMFGTAVCMVPESLARRMRPEPKTRVGRMADKAALLAVVGLATIGAVRAAGAQPAGQAPGPVYQDPVDSPASAHLNEGMAHLYHAPDNPTAVRLMSDIRCMCGCPTESIGDCKCGNAAKERQRVLMALEGKDLSTDAARQAAYEQVRDQFIAEYGERVLLVPLDTGFNRLAWIIPYAAFGGALVLIFGIGRYWVRRGRREWETQVAKSDKVDLDDEAADILDDELSKFD